jgi:hypothetical protein
MYCDLRDIDADLLTVSAQKIVPPDRSSEATRLQISRPTLEGSRPVR